MLGELLGDALGEELGDVLGDVLWLLLGLAGSGVELWPEGELVEAGELAEGADDEPDCVSLGEDV